MPAVTIVAAWMSALTGVGPSIASGSHVWSGSCADFATAPPSRPSATRFTSQWFEASPGARAKTVSKSSERVCWMSRKNASAMVASPRAARRGRSRRRRSPAQGSQLVDVEVEVAARDGDDQPEADDHLRGGHGHDGQGEDLAGATPVVPRERDQGQVRAVEHDLEREEHDQRAAAQEDAERAGREQERGHREVPGNLRAEDPERHWIFSPASLRECEPRITPPIAATRSTIDVISKASRWSVRKSRPTWCGLPNEERTCCWCDSRPPALSPIATTISTRIAPAAATAPTCCQVGPPAQGASARPPRYAVTNRNITITAPA